MNIFENIPEIICSVNPEDVFDFLFYLTGFTLITVWIIRTSFGAKALDGSQPRRNNMPPIIPVAIIFTVFLFIFSASQLLLLIFDNSQKWQKVFAGELLNIIASLVSIGFILIIIKVYFVRGIKGFGLNIKTIPKDLIIALLYLIAILPIMDLLLAAIVFFNEIIFGPDYKIPTHVELQSLQENSNIMVRFAIAFGTILVVPFLEEILFRGLFQTMIRSSLYFFKHAAWIAILMTSVFFAVTHANPSHWLVLFVLSIAIGYSYEKSGSLFRPVFMHMLFNAAAVISTWIQ